MVKFLNITKRHEWMKEKCERVCMTTIGIKVQASQL
jgi:hypothetical protein